MPDNQIKVQITPLMIKKLFKALPKSNAYVQMAALAEAMHELAMHNRPEKCLDTARTDCHNFIDSIFDQAEADHGF
jgi:hypothetical protein